ncbi:hypothetical protein WJX74_000940 [Apatococcus lobatus]|uniref:Uncharacterized protein n=1 Tax=Apatococcus lobatus TaxID=904363 RepID=A0AAW1RA31_9CHLO
MVSVRRTARSATQVCLILAGALRAFALDHTHVNNLSSKDICATTSYFTNVPPLVGTGHSQFISRRVAAHKSDVDEYKNVDQVRVEVWVLEGGQSCDTATGQHGTITIRSDSSISLKDSSDQGVDVFDAGTSNQLKPRAFSVYSAPSFVGKPTNQNLPDGVRVATLQDVQNPHLDLSKAGLSHDSIAELVDGWIKGSDGNYATGSDDSPNFNTHLGIVDPSLPSGYTGDGYDCVPLTADPGNRLAKRSQSDVDAALPSLTKRRPYAESSAHMKSVMKELIAMWDLDGLQATGKQWSNIKTIKDGGTTYRIDQQWNSPHLMHGETYWQLAVQTGSNVYAVLYVPAGVKVSVGGIKKGLYQSLDKSQDVIFTKSTRKSWHWALWLSGPVGLIALIL